MSTEEELAVVTHACSVGRADIVSKAIASLRSTHSSEEVSRALSAIRTENNESLLHLCSKRGYSDVIRVLLTAGVDPTQRIDKLKAYDVATDTAKKTFSTYLFERIALDDNDQVTILLRSGLPCDNNVIHWACSFGHINIVKTLLIFGADLDEVDSEGNTALHIAAQNGFTELVDILLNENCKRNVFNNKNQLAIDLIPDGNEELRALLLKEIEPKMTYTQLALAKVHEISELERVEDAAEESFVKQSLIGAGFLDEEDEDVGGELDADQEIEDEEEDISRELLLWPVPQKYAVPKSSPLILKCFGTLFVCVESKTIDMAPMLTWTGFIDIFSRLNIRVEVQRSADISKVILAVDAALCPGRHRYQIQINMSHVYILASDQTGLMYALNTFVQYLQLYGELQESHDASSEILIPAVEIQDWPDVLNRAVLWSYSDSCLTAAMALRSMVEIFSKLRINRLLLLLSGEDNTGNKVKSKAYLISLRTWHRTLWVSILWMKFVIATV